MERLPEIEMDKPHEECGVFGIFAAEQPVAALTYRALLDLQHRGQDAAGIAVSDGELMHVVKDVGLVDEALNYGKNIVGLPENAYIGIGHVRYGTINTRDTNERYRAAGPHFVDRLNNQLALSHNGHIVNTDELCRAGGYERREIVSDSEIVAQLIADDIEDKDRTLEQATMDVLRRVNGSYAMTIMSDDKLIGVRDPNGFRPLMLGRYQGGYVLASEVPALPRGTEDWRELEPGEMVSIDKTGLRSFRPFGAAPKESLCSFEFIYFSRPDNEMNGETVQLVRERMGALLAREHPADADIVIGVPNSGTAAALGYHRESFIPIGQGLVKNGYVGRSFIAANQEMRENKVRVKLNPIQSIIEGKRLVVVDDSIIRGTTTRTLIEMLREAGAKEVHMRISSSPYRWPCFYGMDTGSFDELLAANMPEAEMAKHIGADSLGFLSLEGIHDAAGKAALKLCDACMSGQYPTSIPVELRTPEPRPSEPVPVVPA